MGLVPGTLDLSHHSITERLNNMRAAEFTTTSVVTVRPETTFRKAAELRTAHGITSLPVLDGDDRVIGIVSESDLR
jgi:CBS domain-containing protein